VVVGAAVGGVVVGAAVGDVVVGAVVGAAIGAVVGAAIGAAVGAVGDAVGADVGGRDVPGKIEIESIEMSPVNDVPRVAIHFTDVVPGASKRYARDQALVTAACCAPLCIHWVVHTVPTQVCTVRFPMVAPAMW
jgi:hypothetical protein